MRLDVYHHLDGAALAVLNEILSTVKTIQRKQETIAMTQQEILDKLAAANASLDGIQADILALKEMLAAGADLSMISDAVDALAVKASGIDSQTP